MAGFKTRGLLTTGKRDAFFDALRAGQRRSQAAIFAGISPKTVEEWIARAEGRGNRPTAPVYQEFLRDVERAEAETEREAIKAVRNAFKRDPRIAWQYLENRSADWRRHRQPAAVGGPVAQIGSIGGTTQVIVVTPELLERYGAEALGEISAPSPEHRALLVEETG